MKKRIEQLIISILICLFPLSAMTEEIFFYHTDNFGTPMAMTDTNGGVVWRADELPFGEEYQPPEEIPEQNNRRFLGKELDKETGLIYMGARYMDPKTGRFNRPDPVGLVDPTTGQVNQEMLVDPQRHNRYVYGLNNPYRYVDPEGLSPDYDKDGDGEVDGNADLSQLAPSPDIPTVSAKDLILMATPVLVGLSPMLPSGGGLNLFKKGKPSTSTSQGWKTGDRMLILRDTGSVKANWNQNASIIRSEMRKGKPIFDSYKRQTTGKRIPTGGFIKGERNLFENKGWEYNPSTGAYHPPGT